jgi:hypothetical protein
MNSSIRPAKAFHMYGMAAFTRLLRMSEEEADKVYNDTLIMVRNNNYHTYGYL